MTGQVAQLVECLPGIHEALVDPQHHTEADLVAYACNLITQDGSIG